MPVVNREVVLPCDRERAWELITEPAELEEWLGEEVEFEASEDAPLRVRDGDQTREGVVEEVTEGERIVFRWGDSRVEWRLEDAVSGTRLYVTEHRFSRDSVTWGPKLMALSAASALCLA
ncbi:SRPBCC domain-containing protein [Solirubrobacter sp. CPCC 204708]|uniref:SRPBCC domain-containing protein n=1 Tax=Solirubrobacter deserti TaxID=2282478 RepID=A0ABT4RBZ2_9ACTN|nr:SRPBCC domain-containing protein [Solirubrobacter deserti]MBE2317062.1 SRPBCC domain-containing protein [Solirubrobacter deserti]MDA0136046.1 SRPBCC domain-containing protein [Solirubrobacter deserti]